MKKRIVCFILFALILSSAALADTGPKPSVRISIDGIQGECYGTLLALEEGTGPAYVWDGIPENAFYQPGDELYEAWKTFVEYDDPDGYHFLQQVWRCDISGSLDWTYYPPQSFKLLLWFPGTDSFIVSDICERYAFESFYDAVCGDGFISIEQSRGIGTVILSLSARMLITIAVELLVALIFSIRGRDKWTFIIVVNIITQIMLNLIVYSAAPAGYGWAFMCMYVICELGVFIVEALLYSLLLPKMCSERMKRPVLYAFIANLLSFVGGIYISRLLPAIF